MHKSAEYLLDFAAKWPTLLLQRCGDGTTFGLTSSSFLLFHHPSASPLSSTFYCMHCLYCCLFLTIYVAYLTRIATRLMVTAWLNTARNSWKKAEEEEEDEERAVQRRGQYNLDYFWFMVMFLKKQNYIPKKRYLNMAWHPCRLPFVLPHEKIFFLIYYRH